MFFFVTQNVILFVSLYLVFWYSLYSLYKGLWVYLAQENIKMTKSHLQGYIPASPASSTLNSGQYATFNRHDLIAQG